MHDPEGLDADPNPDPSDVTDPATEADAAAVASQPDPDAEVAQAQARVDAARARLARLREAAETGDGGGDSERRASVWARSRGAGRRLRRPARPRRPAWLRRPGWFRRPRRTTIAATVGVVVFVASLAASGYMVAQHRAAEHRQRLAAEFAAAGRQGVTALLSIDPEHAKRDVQRMLDASTGDLNSQLAVLSTLMVKKAEDTKVGSKVTVDAVAVESLSNDSGVVLVAAKTDPIGPDNAKPPPALFRVSVNLDRDGGQLKMSKIDFLQ